MMVYFNVDLVKKPKRISFVLQRTPLLPCLQAVFFSSKQFQNLTHQPFLTPTTYIYFWRAFIQLVQCEWWQKASLTAAMDRQKKRKVFMLPLPTQLLPTRLESTFAREEAELKMTWLNLISIQ